MRRTAININDVVENDTVEIDLQKLIMRYLANWWIILICVLLFAGGGYLYTKEFITPLYKASVTIYVNNIRAGNQIDSVTSSNLSTSKALVQTYIKIISSDTVLHKVSEAAGGDIPASDIRGMMSATQEDETELFKVHISNPDPELAAHIANAVAAVVPTEMAEIVEGSSTKIIDYAKVPTTRYTPSFRKNTMISGMLGGALAVAWITISFLMDVRIKDIEDLTQIANYPIIGQIPNFEQVSTKRRHKSGYGYGYETAKVTEKKV